MVDDRNQIDARRRMIKELDERMESLEEHFIAKRLDIKPSTNGQKDTTVIARGKKIS